MSVTATPSAPAAAPSTATPSTPSTPSASKAAPSAPTPARMSTADFKAKMFGRSSQPESASEDTGIDFSSQNYDSDDSDVSDLSADNVESHLEESEEPVEEQPVADDDWSWAESFKSYRDGIHGVATAELLQALSEGTLPDALMDHLTLTMKDGDEEWTGTVADLRNSAQMQANYTRKSQAFAQEKKAFEEDRAELVDYLRSWKEDESGEKGLAGLEKMLGPEAVYRIAAKLAARLERKEQLEAAEAAGHIPPGTAEAVLKQEALAREVEEARRFKERQAQAREQAKFKEQANNQGQRLTNEAINQFKRAGIAQEDLTDGMWNLFKEELGNIWTDPNHTPTPTEIRTAVMAAKQRADAFERKYQAELAAKKAKKPAPVVSGAAPQAAPGAPARAAGSTKKRMSTAEFKQQFMSGGRPFSGR